MARRKNYLYRLVDTYEWDDADLTEEIQSNIEPEYFEKIIEVVDLFNDTELMPEETFEDPVVNKLYHKYYEEYDQCSKIEMIEYMVKQEGFSWKPVEFIELEW
ncbi:MAG: hypothetical protein J6S67_03065 [Methanobrevibacter sp.]|nr:hypothetical protein [Methanobrevibacter sp.]